MSYFRKLRNDYLERVNRIESEMIYFEDSTQEEVKKLLTATRKYVSILEDTIVDLAREDERNDR